MLRSFNIRLITQNNHLLRNLSSGSKDVVRPDYLTINVRNARDPLQVLDVVSSNKTLNSIQTMECLRSLFQLQKGGTDVTIKSEQLTKHPEFETLCHNLKTNSRVLDLNETIEALKILSYLGVTSSSRIMMQLLSLVRHQLNDVTLGHVVFLDFLLRKFETTPLVEAMTIALPLVFQAQLSLQLDHENVKELVDCLGFVARNRASDKSVMSIVTALTLHGETLSAHEAKHILWSMCDINYKPKYEKLVQNCFAVLTRNIDELSFTQVESVLTAVVEKYTRNSPHFYNEAFLDKVAEFVVRESNGTQKFFYILKKFNRISYVSYELLNHLITRLMKDPTMLHTATPGIIFTLVSALSTASYVTPDVELLLDHILANPLFANEKVEFPWMKFAVEFFSIGGFNDGLTQRLFSDEFLSRFFERSNNMLDYFLLLHLHQSVTLLKPEYTGPFPDAKYLNHAKLNVTFDLPLEQSLKYLYGSKQIFNRVRTKLGHFMDHVIAFDRNNKVLDLNEMEIENVYLEDLLHPERKIVAIISPPKTHHVHNVPGKLKGIFELRIQGLETLVPVVVVSQKSFTDLADYEKLPYLQQKIEEKLR